MHAGDVGYDVIGDVHGQAGKLRALLGRMGYEETADGWRHPERVAVFVGDFVDRGSEQVAVYEIARAMVESGAALAIMGNHEFNALAFATPDPDRPGEFLRPHSTKNRGQHAAFLEEVGWESPRHREMLAWFRTLPLWLDLGRDDHRLRVVHACWDPVAMATVDRRLSDELLVAASREGSREWQAVEHLLKGPEIPLRSSYRDKDGNERTRARFQWWREDAAEPAHAVVPSSARSRPRPTLPIVPPVPPYRDDVPVVFGHYWRTGTPAPLTERAACVDYSAGTDGPLVAYRWDGERVLAADHFAVSSP